MVRSIFPIALAESHDSEMQQDNWQQLRVSFTLAIKQWGENNAGDDHLAQSYIHVCTCSLLNTICKPTFSFKAFCIVSDGV